jgi:hypothetical protein
MALSENSRAATWSVQGFEVRLPDDSGARASLANLRKVASLGVLRTTFLPSTHLLISAASPVSKLYYPEAILLVSGPCFEPTRSSIPPPSGLENMSTSAADPEREHALQEFKSKLLDSRECEAKLKALRLEIKGLQKEYDISEENIKALQSVGQIIGEVLKQLDDERCEL